MFLMNKKSEKNCIFVVAMLDFGPNYWSISGSKMEKKYFSLNFTILTQHAQHIDL